MVDFVARHFNAGVLGAHFNAGVLGAHSNAGVLGPPSNWRLNQVSEKIFFNVCDIKTD